MSTETELSIATTFLILLFIILIIYLIVRSDERFSNVFIAPLSKTIIKKKSIIKVLK